MWQITPIESDRGDICSNLRQVLHARDVAVDLRQVRPKGIEFVKLRGKTSRKHSAEGMPAGRGNIWQDVGKAVIDDGVHAGCEQLIRGNLHLLWGCLIEGIRPYKGFAPDNCAAINVRGRRSHFEKVRDA